MELLEFVGVASLLGLLPAVLARRKGERFVLWWIYGALLFVIALPHALLKRTNQKAIEAQALHAGGKKCPFCAEVVKAEARVCRYCGRDLAPPGPMPPGRRPPAPGRSRRDEDEPGTVWDIGTEK